jgi:hypothetical protein
MNPIASGTALSKPRCVYKKGSKPNEAIVKTGLMRKYQRRTAFK